MFLNLCPYCDRELTLTDDRHGRNVKCPGCGRFFEANRPPISPPPTVPPRAAPPPEVAPVTAAQRPELPTPVLTNPQQCHQCRCSLQQPTGHRRSAILCPLCNRPTSVYAVLYRCPSCRARLETPRSQAGNTTCCPRCLRETPVPADVLRRLGEGGAEPGRFCFACPACGCVQQAEPRHAATLAVCVSCETAITVPPGGQAVPGLRANLPDAADPTHPILLRRCPRCDMDAPRDGASCPFCGEPFA